MSLAVGRLVNADGRTQLGTAFAVTGDLALTAFHCIGDRHSGTIREQTVVVQIDGSDVRAEVQDGDPSDDVALLRLCERLPSGVDPGRLSEGVAVGDAFVAPGFPEEIEQAGRLTASGDVKALDTPVLGSARALELYCREAAAELSLHGVSGAPVLVGEPQRAVGVVRWNEPRADREELAAGATVFACPTRRVLAHWDTLAAARFRAVNEIPLAVPYEVPRPKCLSRLTAALTDRLGQQEPGRAVVGLVGMGGLGKSVLAAAAARDASISAAFSERFWLDVGSAPTIVSLQTQLAAAFGSSAPISTVQEGRARLSQLLADRAVLIVLDNVWRKHDLSAFNVVGPRCRLLATTRDATTLPRDAAAIALDLLEPAAALVLLSRWTDTAPQDLPPEAPELAQECGYLPLALAICGAMVADDTYGWGQLLRLLKSADFDALRTRYSDYPHPSLAVALRAGVDALPAEVKLRYQQLLVFRDQGPVPLAALEVLWRLGEKETHAAVEGLADKSLLRFDGQRITLHNLQTDYRALLPEPPAYGAWPARSEQRNLRMCRWAP